MYMQLQLGLAQAQFINTSMTLRFPNNPTYISELSSSNFSPGIKSSVRRRTRWPRMDIAITTTSHRHRRKDKEKERVVVVMGATGAGKSKLSIELATRFFPSSEIINSDKIQVYKGLDITTNKIPIHERQGVPHHLLGEVEFSDIDFTPLDYRSTASSIISEITYRKNLPLLVGGSNSFIYALLADKFDPATDVFNGSHFISSDLRYNCCFIWVDISPGVLSEYLLKRVDDMFDAGMFDELSEFYDPENQDRKYDAGIRKAIGIPEFDRYFQRYPPEKQHRRQRMDSARREWYEEAVKAIKENTCQLAKRQIGKILRLRGAGWDLKRVDATESFREVMMTSNSGEKKVSEYWEKQVVEPSVKIVKRFLDE